MPLGWFNCALEQFIKQLAGDDVWRAAFADAASASAVPWMALGQPAADTAALALFCSVAQSPLLDITPHQLLEGFGEFFVTYLAEQGYVSLLRTLGTSLLEFLQNLNDLHLHLGLLLPTMAAPAFTCTDVGPTSLTLLYHSHRPALGPIVVGLLKGLAEHYWGLGGGQLQVELLLRGRGDDDGTSVDDHQDMGADCDVFLVSYPYQEVLRLWQPSPQPPSSRRQQQSTPTAAAHEAAAAATSARSFTLSPDSFYKLFPFHLLLDRSCRVVQAGAVLERLFPELCRGSGRAGAGVPLEEVFQMHAPSSTITYESLRLGQNDTVLLRARATGLDLKGQVLPVRLPCCSSGVPGGPPQPQEAAAGGCPRRLDQGPQQPHALNGEPHRGGEAGEVGEEEGLLFLGSPWLAGLAGMCRHGICISDIPRHDATRDVVMLSEQRNAETHSKQGLEALTLELKEANARLGEMTGWLDEERRRSDGLLYQMLPPEVASCLKDGNRAPAQEHPEATVLFSDIVGFTEIASRSSPLEVCSLLDELYQRFDAAIEEYPQLYKVETIGDAYMVVCNVTVPCDDHADVLLEFALRMHEEASQVASSLGEPVRIRVGMHSGPVVAGVVGRKMPRFCLFGDTVNTASRMESHGEAGKIHISEACYSCLRAKERFLIRERGDITVKGKGAMRTYLLSPPEQAGVCSPFTPLSLRHHFSGDDCSSPTPPPPPPAGGLQEPLQTSGCLERRLLLSTSRSTGAHTSEFAAAAGSPPQCAALPAMMLTADECASMWARALDPWGPAPLASTTGGTAAKVAAGSSPVAAAEPWAAAGGGPSSCSLPIPAPAPGEVGAGGLEERGALSSRLLVHQVPATPQSDATSMSRPGRDSVSGSQPMSNTVCGLLSRASPHSSAAAAAAGRVATTYLDVSAEMLTHISNLRLGRSSCGALAAGFSWNGGNGGPVSAMASPISPQACTPNYARSSKGTSPPPAGMRQSPCISAPLVAKLPPPLAVAQPCQTRQECEEPSDGAEFVGTLFTMPDAVLE